MATPWFIQTQKWQMVGRGAFCKKLVPSRVSLFGAPKGALGAVSSRESGTSRIAPGRHFWASLVSRMRKTTFSEAAKTRDIFWPPWYARIGGPLGAPVFALPTHCRVPWDAPWDRFGVPEGPEINGKPET